MKSKDVIRIVVAAIAGAIAFATLPLSFQSFWILRVARDDDGGAHGDLSVLTNAEFLFLGIGAVIGFTVAATKMRPMRAALFGSVFGLVLSLVAMTINWSEVNEVTAVANIVYYMVPGLCAGLASGWVSRVLGGSYRKTT
jgi:hypothetical protein